MITIECNQRCSKCSHWKQKDQSDRLNPDLISNAINKITSVEEFIIVGGEPLIYKKEIEKIISKIENKSIRTTIITNGVLMDKDFVKFVSEHNIHVVFSLDTIDKEFWKFVRGSNSMGLVMNNFEYAVKTLNKNKLSIQSVLSKETEPFVKDVENYADKIGIYHSSQLYMNDGFNGNWTPIDYESRNVDYSAIKCVAAGKNLSIMQNGNVFTCFQQPWINGCEKPTGNLKTEKAIDILTKQYTEEVYEKMKLCNLPCKVLKCNIE